MNRPKFRRRPAPDPIEVGGLLVALALAAFIALVVAMQAAAIYLEV